MIDQNGMQWRMIERDFLLTLYAFAAMYTYKQVVVDTGGDAVYCDLG